MFLRTTDYGHGSGNTPERRFAIGFLSSSEAKCQAVSHAGCKPALRHAKNSLTTDFRDDTDPDTDRSGAGEENGASTVAANQTGLVSVSIREIRG